MSKARLTTGLTVDCVATALLGVLLVRLSPALDTLKEQQSRPKQITLSALLSLLLAMIYLLVAITYESIGLQSEPGRTICLLNEFLPILWQMSRCSVQIFFAYRIELTMDPCWPFPIAKC